MEKTAPDVDVTLATASCTLTRPQAERIINPELHQPSLPPWGEGTADGWRNRWGALTAVPCRGGVSAWGGRGGWGIEVSARWCDRSPYHVTPGI